MHPWHDVIPGQNLPKEFRMVVEIPKGSNVKYELDKPTGLLKLAAAQIVPEYPLVTSSALKVAPRSTQSA